MTWDTQNSPLVSIIMPTYNVESFIEEALNSLLRQSLQSIELLIVDDGSTDRTCEVISRVAARDPRVKLLQKENGGPASARNFGLRFASGQYVCFIDSDDVVPETALAEMVEAAKVHEADVVTGVQLRFNSSGKWFIKVHFDKGLTRSGERCIDTNPELFYSLGAGKLYRTDLIRDIRFPEEIKVGEDQPFVIEAFLRAKKIYTLGSIVYYYRVRETEEKSLTQIALQDPVGAITDLFRMVSLVSPKLQGRGRLLADYMERVISMDIWPRVRAGLSSRDCTLQVRLLDMMAGWLAKWDDGLLDKVPAVRYWFLKGIIDRITVLRIPALHAYRGLLEVLFSRLSPSALKAFQKQHKIVYQVAYETVACGTIQPLIKHSCRKRYKGAKSRIRNFVLKRFCFGIGKLLPARREVVLATNKSADLRGNLRAVYDHMFLNNIDDWGVRVCLSKKRSFLELAGQYLCLGRAQVVALDDYYHQLYGLRPRKGRQVVQLWHACGAFKKFGFSSFGYIDSNTPAFEALAHSSYTRVVTSSKNIADIYAEAFGVSVSDVVSTGVPRTDIFFDKELIEYTRRKYRLRYPLIRGKKVILYAPTFRGRPNQRTSFDLQLNLKKMKEELAADYVLLLKLHPSVKNALNLDAGLDDFVIDVSHVPEINELLLSADVLITDYSSIVFEFSLLRRPMIFFAYDLKDYLFERGFYYNYEEFVPGPIAYTTEEVIYHILNPNKDLSVVENFSRYFFDRFDGESTKRFVAEFLK
ncbi:MAG: CDP-glycerol:glycerophosphate glycerophosphotransferase [Alicyclobacillus herbarius]|uniref:bifunctional glycosyltransferase/CDP-glycerol:glycerophosphate glycerophosphotransferase n=1 Tax=Alicyclobacillus herbarius TaxID=122960 RepID=UPI0023535E0B|nr:CDP-glycerol:glycerophosphate glycerophosphotransferase [Alicyclobacillus herbarius]MCL6633660.1 CDP-glycerol:glycerophosphate glycerophosphotransferase [Alicyclobacillus herbarius]